MNAHIINKSSWVVFVLLGLIACQNHPEPINFGTDQCDYCKMTIVDEKFGSELVTPQGRILKYDAAECMAHAIGRDGQEFSALYAIPMDQPGQLISADSLHFVIDENIRSPMGANLAGFAQKENAEDYDSPPISWIEVLKKLNK